MELIWFFIWAGLGAFFLGFFGHLATFGVDRGEISPQAGKWFERAIWGVYAVMFVTMWFLPESSYALFDWIAPAA